MDGIGNTLAPYREIFINFHLFPLLFPYLFFSSDSVQGDALPGLLLQIGSFPLSPFLSSQGERGKWFRHRLWLLTSGLGVGVRGPMVLIVEGPQPHSKEKIGGLSLTSFKES